MGWSELRDGLAHSLPSSAINLNKRFTMVQQHKGHVELHFADGTSVDAKIVVGADGCFSKVRQQSLGDGLPDFTVSHSLLYTRASLPHAFQSALWFVHAAACLSVHNTFSAMLGYILHTMHKCRLSKHG